MLLVLVFALGLLLGGRGTDAPHAVSDASDAEPTIWTCSMHPQIRLPEPGQCPICFMDLIPLVQGADEDLGPRTLVLSAAAAALAEIRTAPVETATTESAVPVRLIGKVIYDETSYRTITAWVAGRIDTLLVNATGMNVRAGQGMASLYSPDLYAAQVELLDAARTAAALADGPDAAMARSARQTVEAARRRLTLWGLSAAQVREIERSGAAREHVRIPAPQGGVVVHMEASEGMYVQPGSKLYTVADLRRVWVSLDAYESDLAWLAVGQDVTFRVAALPDRTFTGRVVFIDPVLDKRTRTAGVRLEVDNPDGGLRPGMFVTATANSGFAALSAGRGQGGPVLTIPATAPLLTGKRAVVYVKIPGKEKPTFEGREVVLGPRLGDRYVVASGLNEGEQVVSRGAFKLDSALQIQARPSMMSPPEAAASAGAGPSDPLDDVPAAFLHELRPVLDGYLGLQAALAADDGAGARVAVAAVRDAIAAVDMDAAGPAHAAWMRDAAALGEVLAPMDAADSIEATRSGIQDLTAHLWNALVRYGYEDGRTVRRFHCPMARDGVGGDWIQLEPETANPYYGAMMLRCGSETAVLQPAAKEEER
ncbi:MAG TPA: efflux RND transporter periplasmic adaptor subunit [Candidatus Krumholzibacteria bacterium]|nr:efflux RND transporter periplasmic adaptor subunit [Candidatus Krumholzibacteria bacterium]